MTAVLSPTPQQQFFDNNGNPLAGGKLFTYAAGTSTKVATYVDSAGVTPNSNPVVLDFRGSCRLWLPPNVAYKYVLAPANDTDPPTNPFWTVDNVVSSQLVTLYGGVDTGSANAYVLNFTANFTAYTDGIIIYWVPANTNTTLSTINVNGLGAVQIVDQNGSGLLAGKIIANQVTSVIYRGGKFYLLSTTPFSSFYTGTLTGMTGSVTGSILYSIFGGICTLHAGVNMLGTSNTTAMTLTGMPAEARPSSSIQFPCAGVQDNTLDVLAVATIGVSGTISFSVQKVSGTTIVPGVFTNVGTKGLTVNWTISYPVSL